jgi:hypothetical protein
MTNVILIENNIPTKEEALARLEFWKKELPNSKLRAIPATSSLITFSCDGYVIEELKDKGK